MMCLGTLTVGLEAQDSLWSDGTARTLTKSRIELGILYTPSRYGLNEDIELSTYPIWDILVPGISLKKFWTTSIGFLISSSHGISSPTPLLRFLAKEKTGGLLPPDVYVPFFLVFENYFIASKEIIRQHWTTVSAGGKIAFALSDKSPDHPAYERLQTIDYPFVFPRTAYLTSAPSFSPDIGISFTGPFVWSWSYSAESHLFYFGMKDNLRDENRTCWAFEQSAMIVWPVSRSFLLQCGAVYSVGSFPFGSNWVLYPLVDCKIGLGGSQEW